MFNGELGLQFALQVASHYTTSELVELAELGAQSGFHEVWLSDALRYRNIVGWRRRSPRAVFLNSIDVADSLLALSLSLPEAGRSVS